MRDHVYTLKVWSDKCLNMPIVTRAHAPATGRGHARGRLQGARRVGARLLRLAPGDELRGGRFVPAQAASGNKVFTVEPCKLEVSCHSPIEACN